MHSHGLRRGVFYILFRKAADNQDIILSAEAEGFAHHDIHIGLTRLVGDVVQVQCRVRIVQVHRHRQGLLFDGFDAGDQFCAAGGTDEMTELAFWTAARDVFGVVAEDGFDRYCFDGVVFSGAGAMRADIVDIAGGQTGVLEPRTDRLNGPAGLFVHIRDVTLAFSLAAHRLLEGAGTNKECFSVSSGAPISLRDLVAQVRQITEMRLAVTWGTRPYRDREVMRLWSGTSLPGWKPSVTLTEGLRELFEIR